ncbi:MAG: phosphopantothenoylcysteine decarboxylase [Candidatus Omnitrophica bacterium]|nr:phosphopantothenoylcysteine decarboxylase [Candidatus Omnitrophota bacterium]
MKRSHSRRNNPSPQKKRKTVIFGLTGSIACYKACDVISNLAFESCKVICVLTQGAKQFITPLTLASLSGHPVYEDQFMEPPFSEPLHTRLAREADLVVIAPATANMIAKIAAGLADDLLTSIVLATRADILIAPAMNEQMWLNPFTQENVRKLKQGGMHFIDPVRGHLVCQIEGVGHIAEAEIITAQIKELLK